jgi:hypothetical protein
MKEFEKIPVADLKPYPKNARKHSQTQLDMIAASIREFGFVAPVIVDENNMILVGHGRVEAAKMAGLDAVPVRRVTNLSEDQKRGYILADNKLSDLGEWDFELLHQELDSIDIDMTAFGFDGGGYDLDFMDFDGTGDGGGSVMMAGIKLRVVIGAAVVDIDDHDHELYAITKNIDHDKLADFVLNALLNGDLS